MILKTRPRYLWNLGMDGETMENEYKVVLTEYYRFRFDTRKFQNTFYLTSNERNRKLIENNINFSIAHCFLRRLRQENGSVPQRLLGVLFVAIKRNIGSTVLRKIRILEEALKVNLEYLGCSFLFERFFRKHHISRSLRGFWKKLGCCSWEKNTKEKNAKLGGI
jgi:hypothetical protein